MGNGARCFSGQQKGRKEKQKTWGITGNSLAMRGDYKRGAPGDHWDPALHGPGAAEPPLLAGPLLGTGKKNELFGFFCLFCFVSPMWLEVGLHSTEAGGFG